MFKERHHGLNHLGFTVRSRKGGNLPNAVVQKELCNFFLLSWEAAGVDF